MDRYQFLLSFHFNAILCTIKKHSVILLTGIASIFIVTNITLAQQPNQVWVNRWPTPESPVFASGRSIKADNEQNLYVLSDTGIGFGFLKYSANGSLLFSTHHSPSGFTSGRASYFDVTPSGDVYTTGQVYIDFDYWIYTVKFNKFGVMQWARLFNKDLRDLPNDIKVDNDNNIIIAGGANISTNTFSLLIKYNPSGDTIWTRYFNDQNRGRLDKIFIDNANNIYGVGVCSPIPGKSLIIKYASNGNLLWNQSFTLDIQRANIGWGIYADQNSNVYTIGTQVRPQSEIDTYLLKLKPNGDTAWSRTYPRFGQGNFSLWGPVIHTDDNSIYYTGSYRESTPAGYDIKTLRYDSAGTLNWVQTFNGDPTKLDLPKKIKLDQSGNIYVCGHANYNATGDDLICLKYLPTGVLQWTITYLGIVSNGADDGVDFTFDSNNSIYITGSSRKSISSNDDAITLKYDQIIGINSSDEELPSSFKLFSNYPNPFNGTTIISYSIPLKSYIKIELYNISGQLIKKIVDRSHEVGYYSIALNTENLSSGIYFYKLEAGDFVQTRKMVLVK